MAGAKGTRRFADLLSEEPNRDQAAPVVEVATPARGIPDDLPAPTTAGFVARKSLGVRVRTDLAENLGDLTEALRAKGWRVREHTLIEYFLDRLSDPAFVRQMLTELQAKDA